MNNDCLYCNNNQTQKDLMIEICKLKVSTAFLFREQTYKGRCIVAYKDHAKELYELKGQDLADFMEDVNAVARAINTAFSPIKINYGAYSDKLPHLHFHLVPKYIDGPDFGGVFAMNPQKTYLSDDEYAARITLIKDQLTK
ncbi:MAG: HIT family protein [Dysgonomonas sp.]